MFKKAFRKTPHSRRYKWWKDKEFMKELDRRHKALESGEDKGVSMEEFRISIEKAIAEMRAKKQADTSI